MRVRIETPDAAEGTSLHGWLRADPDLTHTADVSVPPTAPGSMGAFDVVELVLTQATAMGGLAVSIATWLGTRRRRPDLTITRADGATLTVAAGSAPDPELIATFLSGGSLSAGHDRARADGARDSGDDARARVDGGGSGDERARARVDGGDDDRARADGGGDDVRARARDGGGGGGGERARDDGARDDGARDDGARDDGARDGCGDERAGDGREGSVEGD